MMELNSGAQSQRPVSEFEEHAWLLQQQFPERVLKHFSAWRLGEDIDLARLQGAIATVVASLPALNARYRFNDDGDVQRFTTAIRRPASVN